MPTLDFLTALDPDACSLTSGDLRAVFLPGRGMLGASLEHRGEQLLGRVDDIAAFAASGRTCGIPFLHPWANRLAAPSYNAAGRQVSLDAAPLIGHDESGLPMHGVPWPRLRWQVVERSTGSHKAQLDWNSDERLAIFPFPHRIEMAVQLSDSALLIETTLSADGEVAVPVSFGFHPYVKIPGLPRAEWRVRVPAMRRLVTDERNIPTGQEKSFAALDDALGDRALDDGFALLNEDATFSIRGNGRRIVIEFLEGYHYAQVFAPAGKDYIAIEPMTAPANALVSGRGLNVVPPGREFRAAFRIRIE